MISGCCCAEPHTTRLFCPSLPTIMIPVSYMSLATSLIDGGKSFEEVRIDDYIQAYMATGKPPQPVTQFSDGDKGQSTLGLPPIFKPTSEHDPILANRPKETAPPLAAQPVTANGPPKKDLTDIPAVQEFKGERVGNETFYTISCAEQFSGYSPEELRHHAYKNGQKPPPSSSDELQSISSKPEFAQHSFEELRIVFMLAGRELTSAEIIAAMQGK